MGGAGAATVLWLHTFQNDLTFTSNHLVFIIIKKHDYSSTSCFFFKFYVLSFSFLLVGGEDLDLLQTSFIIPVYLDSTTLCLDSELTVSIVHC